MSDSKRDRCCSRSRLVVVGVASDNRILVDGLVEIRPARRRLGSGLRRRAVGLGGLVAPDLTEALDFQALEAGALLAVLAGSSSPASSDLAVDAIALRDGQRRGLVAEHDDFEPSCDRLFESGAIVLHIGERSEMLLPKDATPCTCCGSKAADLQHPSARSTDIALAFNTRAEDWG